MGVPRNSETSWEYIEFPPVWGVQLLGEGQETSSELNDSTLDIFCAWYWTMLSGSQGECCAMVVSGSVKQLEVP